MSRQGFIRSVVVAGSGVWCALRRERNLKIHAVFAVLVPLAALALHVSALELALLVAMIGSVVAAELLNSALEAAVDLASPDVHPLAKTAKDTAAGAVLVLSAAAAIVGLLVLTPHLHFLF